MFYALLLSWPGRTRAVGGQSTGADTGSRRAVDRGGHGGPLSGALAPLGGACALGGRLRPYWSHQSWAPGPAMGQLRSVLVHDTYIRFSQQKYFLRVTICETRTVG